MAKDVAKPRSIKVTDAMWSNWQALAQAKGVSVAALIIARVEQSDRSDAVVPTDDTLGVLKLRGEIETLTKAGAAKDREIAELKKVGAASKGKPVIPGPGRKGGMRAAKPVSVPGGQARGKNVGGLPSLPKPVAAVLPVAGTDFPARPVYLRGQAPGKEKDKS